MLFPCRFLLNYIVAIALILMTILVFLTLMLSLLIIKQFDHGKQGGACQTSKENSKWPQSFCHIDQELSRRLLQVWQSFSGEDRHPVGARYNLNVDSSNRLSFDRPLPKVRTDVCDSIIYDEDKLPKLCVVVPIYNEALSVLFRTVHSILNRTPVELLAEIILVDDFSTQENLGSPLEAYVNLLPKVKIIRHTVREGLIRARLSGLAECTGEVVIFLDAHTEVNERWAQPILYHLQRHPNHLVTPTIEQIDADSFNYSGGSFEERTPFTSTFAWDLRYVWRDAPHRVLEFRRSFADPVPTPTIVGCSIAVNRDYFQQIGTFDDKMNIWGGENLEISFRYWQCGGAVLVHPCSRIGHIFKRLPYSFSPNAHMMQVVSENVGRVVEVWMDSYKDYYYSTTWQHPEKRFNYSTQFLAEISERRRTTRDRFNCKPFRWYLEKVTPEVLVPPDDAILYGEIFNVKTSWCMKLLASGYAGATEYCDRAGSNPDLHFFITKGGQLRLAGMDDTCFVVDSDTSTGRLVAVSCLDDAERVQSTRFYLYGDDKEGQLVVSFAIDGAKEETLCATFVNNAGTNEEGETATVRLTDCSAENDYQQWYFVHKFQHEFMPKLDEIVPPVV